MSALRLYVNNKWEAIWWLWKKNAFNARNFHPRLSTRDTLYSRARHSPADWTARWLNKISRVLCLCWWPSRPTWSLERAVWVTFNDFQTYGPFFGYSPIMWNIYWKNHFLNRLGAFCLLSKWIQSMPLFSFVYVIWSDWTCAYVKSVKFISSVKCNIFYSYNTEYCKGFSKLKQKFSPTI